jgi:hypothetical protein
VISHNSLRSEGVQREFSAVALQQLSTRERRIIPIRLDDCEVPSYFADVPYIDLSTDFTQGLQRLSDTLKLPSRKLIEEALSRGSVADTREAHVARLRDLLRKGRLTLFCGAGVSVGAGIPGWNALLAKLLEIMLQRISQKHSLDLGRKAALELQRKGASSLILAKYLKNNLGRDFPTTCVRRSIRRVRQLVL